LSEDNLPKFDSQVNPTQRGEQDEVGKLAVSTFGGHAARWLNNLELACRFERSRKLKRPTLRSSSKGPGIPSRCNLWSTS